MTVAMSPFTFAGKQLLRDRHVALLVWDEQPAGEIERHGESPDEREGDEADAHDGRVDVEVVGQAEGDTAQHPPWAAPAQALLVVPPGRGWGEGGVACAGRCAGGAGGSGGGVSEGGVHVVSLTGTAGRVNPATPWCDPEGPPDRSGMSLIAGVLDPRDHRGIENGPDPGPRPRTDEGRPSEPWTDAGSWTPDGEWRGDAWGWHGRWHHHRRRGARLRCMRRTPDNRVLGGVAGGVSKATGIDVMWIRIGFVLLTIMSGVMVLGYALAWLLIPMEGATTNIATRAMGDRRGLRLVMAVCLPLLIVMQIVVSSLHVGFVGFLGWPTVLAAGLLVLIWRNAEPDEKQFIDSDIVPLLGADTHGGRRRWLVLRVAAGVAVLGLGIYLLVKGHTTVTALRPVGGAALVVAASVIIFGPWWLSLIRDLIVERQARVRAEERTQMAAHVHDSVLQTLALIQRSADDPQNVVRLARAQERELRSWLFEGRPPGAIGDEATTLSEGIDLLQRHVEADHGITVQVVLVGDCDLSDTLRALLDAAKEATVNAAKWAGVEEVSLYAEVEPDQVMLYVRDRGRGFDPDAVPDGRQGIAQSIKARVERHGGSAVIRSAPGQGAEVQLSMPRRERVR